MTDLEDLVVKEATRLGCRVSQDAIRQAGIDLAGAAMTSQGLIHLPGRGSISPADFTRSLRQRMPACFSEIGAYKADAKPASTLTEAMIREVEATRQARRLPDDWQAVRSKATGITAEHMAEREGNWK
jgi:hypothetical protein